MDAAASAASGDDPAQNQDIFRIPKERFDFYDVIQFSILFPHGGNDFNQVSVRSYGGAIGTSVEVSHDRVYLAFRNTSETTRSSLEVRANIHPLLLNASGRPNCRHAAWTFEASMSTGARANNYPLLEVWANNYPLPRHGRSKGE